MLYYDGLNKVIDTIEKELTNNIDYNELAKIVGISSYSLQRIFAFLTGITLTEYIRKRRLSKAAEEIQRTDEKIIDIAIKYQYNSPVSFSNAFKKMHGISPANARKSNHKLKVFDKIEFKPTIEEIKEFKYRIVEMEEQEFYGVATGVISNQNKKAIRDLYTKAELDGTMEILIKNSNQEELYYGIYAPVINNEEYTNNARYYIASKQKRDDFKKVKIQKGLWVCFTLSSNEQGNILELYNYIYRKWLPSSGYSEALYYAHIEIYYKDYCEICIAVEKT